MTRKILHVDMDAFFARVEKVDRPELRGEAVVVGGQSERGVVSTACYRARQHGIHSAMPMRQARQLCPQAEFLPVRGERYKKVSKNLLQIMRSYTPQVEPVSLDEAYLDVSGVLHRYNSAYQLGQQIKEEINEQTHLTCSVGIGPNKMIAKLASEDCKPDGLQEVEEKEKDNFLLRLPLGAIPGIGEKTGEKLQNIGIDSIRKLREAEVSHLKQELGIRGIILQKRVLGEDPTPVKTAEETKSISNEETYSEDLEERSKIKKLLFRLTEKVGRRLRDKKLEAKTVEIKVRRGDFTTLTRSYTGRRHTDVTERLCKAMAALFDEVKIDERGVRLLGVGVSNLRPADSQEELFEASDEQRKARLNELMDNLNEEYGDQTIVRGGTIIAQD